MPAGAIVLVYGERGSRENPSIEAKVYTGQPDGTLTTEAAARGREWARTLRDTVEELVASTPPMVCRAWSPDLAAYSDEAILEEVRRRRLTWRGTDG